MTSVEGFLLTILILLGALTAVVKRKTIATIFNVPELPLRPSPLKPNIPDVPAIAGDPRLEEVQRIVKKLKGTRNEVLEDRAIAAWRLAQETSEQTGVDPALLMAIWHQESRFNPAAINASDPSYGLGQIQTFWVDGRIGLTGTKQDLLQPAFNARATAAVLLYFQGAQDLQPYRSFQFPDEADVYNVGETKYRKGTRNPAYREAIQKNFVEWSTTR